MIRHSNDGLYKRCDCGHRKWLKCDHPWHFDFYCEKTRHLYGGKAKHRYSLAKLSGDVEPMNKERAKELRDVYRAQIRAGTFVDPTAALPSIEVPSDTRLTFGDVADRYQRDYVRVPTRRKRAAYAIECHLNVLKEAEVPGPRGSVISLGAKPIADITQADIEALRRTQRRAMQKAIEDRAQWETEAALTKGRQMTRPKPRRMAKGGETGINRLLARLRALFNWALAAGDIERSPFKRGGITVVKLDGRAEKRRRRRLHAGEETALLAQAGPHLQALIVAALETGCRVGELLSLQWRDVEWRTGPKGDAIANRIVLPADKTKTYETRDIPVTQRLAGILAMRRTAPDGKEFGSESHVFGNEAGEQIASIKTAWYATCRRARIEDLHFHDLRREFASRVRETPGNSDHEVRDLLGHANVSTTSRYLGSTPETRERAIRNFEKHQQTAEKSSHTTGECDNDPAGESEREKSPEVSKSEVVM